MLSVCITAYNTDVSALVKKILTQANIANINIDILIGINTELKPSLTDKNITYLYSHELNSAKLKNKLAEKSKYEYILFLDADIEIKSDSFISFYVASIVQKQQIVFGGKINPAQKPNNKYLLAYKYSNITDALDIDIRRKKANNYFSSSNLLINKQLFSSIKFNEEFSKYGYSDEFLAFNILKQNITITQIDNPIITTSSTTNSNFLKNSLKEIDNLIYLEQNTNIDKNFIAEQNIIKQYNNNIAHKYLKFYSVIFPVTKFVLLNLSRNINLLEFLRLLYFSKKFQK